MGKDVRTYLPEYLNTVSKRLKKNIDSLKTMFIKFYIWKGICRSSGTFIWGVTVWGTLIGENNLYLFKTENHF